ncbi:VanZ family protein [Demequina sp.]|uniref:VanZ family protein n=1 Tax=Demequina sp. TaxID=2050685 RepID=UPI003D111641
MTTHFYVGPIVAAAGTALVLGAIAVVPRRPWRWLLWLCLTAVVGMILWLTLALSFGDAGGTGLNLTPFQEIRRVLDSPGERQYLNVVGNVAMFVPVGALLAWLLPRWRVVSATVVSVGLSVGIELAQLSLGRVGDIDDVILNTAGALIGAVLAVTWRALVRPRDEQGTEMGLGAAAG